MGHPATTDVLQAIYDSEINFGISCFWDAGFEVGLGGTPGAWEHETTVESVEEACNWLIHMVIERYPDSDVGRKLEALK